MTHQPMTIYLMDDDDTFSRLMSRKLSRMIKCTTCCFGDINALITETQSKTPDCILLDMNLGNESSLSYIARLRELAPNAKIVMVTGYGSIATTVTAIKNGADDYLSKPVDFNTLLAIIQPDSTHAMVDTVQDQPLSPERLEWEHLQRVLANHDGNVSATARSLNMHRRTLQRKLAKRPVQS